mmetsp:Transcript_8925/g.29512  ORF Transcript_8925/g.29512 Transcript_8925/m.29512 type:complete len:99 (+) Transcript_8925:685-981(+)
MQQLSGERMQLSSAEDQMTTRLDELEAIVLAQAEREQLLNAQVAELTAATQYLEEENAKKEKVLALSRRFLGQALERNPALTEENEPPEGDTTLDAWP